MAEPRTILGYGSRFYRALNTGRIHGGLPRELALMYWGLWSVPLLSFPLRWYWKLVLAVLAIIGHRVLAYLGRDNPYWYRQLQRKWKHADIATAHDPRQLRRP